MFESEQTQKIRQIIEELLNKIKKGPLSSDEFSTLWDRLSPLYVARAKAISETLGDNEAREMFGRDFLEALCDEALKREDVFGAFSKFCEDKEDENTVIAVIQKYTFFNLVAQSYKQEPIIKMSIDSFLRNSSKYSQVQIRHLLKARTLLEL